MDLEYQNFSILTHHFNHH